MNICLSYGSRQEIVAACKSIVAEVVAGKLDIDDLDEIEFQQKLLTKSIPGKF